MMVSYSIPGPGAGAGRGRGRVTLITYGSTILPSSYPGRRVHSRLAYLVQYGYCTQNAVLQIKIKRWPEFYVEIFVQ